MRGKRTIDSPDSPFLCTIMKRLAEIILIALFSLTIVFHILVLAAVIPHDIVWGSRINATEVTTFETISIVLNVLFLSIMLISAGILKVKISPKVINVAIWVMMVVFLLNTVGNLLSESAFEKAVFTPLTLILSICLLIIALANRKKKAVGEG